MRAAHFAACITVLVSLLVLAAQPGGARAEDHPTRRLSPSQQASHEDAVRAFREQRYAAAYGRFAALADAGDAASAQMALLMVSHGLALFGSDWSATPNQQRHWNALVSQRACNS